MLGCPETFCRMSTSFSVASRSSCISLELKLPPPVMSMILTAYSWQVGLWIQRLTTLLTPLWAENRWPWDPTLQGSPLLKAVQGLERKVCN